MPPQPPLLRPLEPLIPFPENSENTLARALSDAAPVHLSSTLEQPPSTLGQASSVLCSVSEIHREISGIYHF